MQDTNYRIKISTLWIIVSLNIAFTDIYSIILYMSEARMPDIPGDAGTMMLIAVFATNIPIAMIFISRVLNRSANRWANFVAGALTILYIIGGGDPAPHYIAAAVIEVSIICVILWMSVRWPAQQGDHAHV